jgi:hypothetical protein
MIHRTKPNVKLKTFKPPNWETLNGTRILSPNKLLRLGAYYHDEGPSHRATSASHILVQINPQPSVYWLSLAHESFKDIFGEEQQWSGFYVPDVSMKATYYEDTTKNFNTEYWVRP